MTAQNRRNWLDGLSPDQKIYVEHCEKMPPSGFAAREFYPSCNQCFGGAKEQWKRFSSFYRQ